MADSDKHILLMDGPDNKGLIYHVTGVLFRHALNVIHNDEYVSPAGRFFMRTEFEAGSCLTGGGGRQFRWYRPAERTTHHPATGYYAPA